MIELLDHSGSRFMFRDHGRSTLVVELEEQSLVISQS
jgi:hypothetical protein